MKFNIDRTSDYYGEHVLPENSRFYGRLNTRRSANGTSFRNTIEIDTLGELLQLVREQGEIIVSFSEKHDNDVEDASIEIYDHYRE